MGFGGIIGGILDHKHQAEMDEVQQRQFNAKMLAGLLDSPEIQLDTKSAIADQLDELMKTPTKQKGMIKGLAHIFHDKPYGDLNSQVPSGPERQTLGSRVQQLTEKTGQQADTSQGLIPTGVSPAEMFQPTQRRGSLTGRDLENASKLNLFNQEQGTRAKYDEQNDQRTQDRQLAVQKSRNDAAANRLAGVLHNKQIFLNDQEQARALREVRSVNAAHPEWTPEEASAFVADKYQQEADLRTSHIAETKAITAALPARLRMEGERVAQGWQRLDLDQVRTQVLSDVARNKGDIEAFDRETKPLFNQLASARKQIEYFNKFSGDPAMAQKLTEEQAYEKDLLNQIYQKQGQYIRPPTTNPTVPQRPSSGGRSPNYRAPKVSGPQLNKVLGLP